MTSGLGTRSGLVSADMRRQFVDEGYFILEDALTTDELEMLRSAAEYAVKKVDLEMEAMGITTQGRQTRNRRYFSYGVHRDLADLRAFLFGETLAEICRSTLGDTAYLHWEQFVVKAPHADTSFSWHQDSGYAHEDHEPFVTCWMALDDISEENGTLYLLPFSRSGIKSYVRHIRDPISDDKVGYFGPDPGIPIEVTAGSIVVLSSVLMHRSGPNLSDAPRRVYVAHFSPEVVMTRDGSRPHGESEPFLRDGVIVSPSVDH